MSLSCEVVLSCVALCVFNPFTGICVFFYLPSFSFPFSMRDGGLNLNSMMFLV